MECETWLGDTRLLSEEQAGALPEAVQRCLDLSTSLICIDTTAFAERESAHAVDVIQRCAALVRRAGGHLSVICPVETVRKGLLGASVPVLWDRDIARVVLG